MPRNQNPDSNPADTIPEGATPSPAPSASTTSTSWVG